MATETPETLVVVFDGAKARFLRRDKKGRLTLEDGDGVGTCPQDERDRVRSPGRTFASAGGGVRSAYEPKHDPHKMEKHNFVHGLVKTLDDSYDRNEFKHLIVVAPERSLGEFRALAPDKLLRVAVEVPKELTQLSVHDLQARLSEFIGT